MDRQDVKPAVGDMEKPEGTVPNRRVTIRDVARMADVSHGTVSRVLNHCSVRAPLRARVLAAMQELGYQPDLLAQSMRTQATMVVGCMVADISIPFFSQMVSGAEHALDRSDYTMMLSNSHGRVEHELKILSLFRGRRVDGLLVTPSREDDPRVLEALGKMPMPVVVVQRTLPIPIDTVTTDHHTGIYEATQYLLSLGHRRVALIAGGTPMALPGRERAAAYRKAHADLGIEVDDNLIAYSQFSVPTAHRIVYEQLTSGQPPTAIIVGAMHMLGVLTAIRSLDLSIPDDISLVSLGDFDFAELHQPPLTVVRWDIAQLGQAAAEMLLSRFKGQARKEPLSMTLPSELVLRKSCAPPRRR